MTIKNYTKCEQCEHNKVCSYQHSLKEDINKLEGHLNNCIVADMDDIFIFSFECKEFKQLETIPKSSFVIER